jgi:hypothetical protein
MALEMPEHVNNYLRENDVDASELSQEAQETFANLTADEVEVLRKVGNSLKGADMRGAADPQLIAKVH